MTSRRAPSPLIPLALLVGIGVVAWVVFLRFQQPLGTQSGRLDAAAIAAADPTTQWWNSRVPVEALDPASLELANPTLWGSSNPALDGGFSGRWRLMRQRERNLLADQTRPIAMGVPGRELSEAIAQLEAATLAATDARMDHAADRYARAIDDFWPSYLTWDTFEPRGIALAQSTFHQVDPRFAGDGFLESTRAIEREVRRDVTRARLRWEATLAALRRDPVFHQAPLYDRGADTAFITELARLESLAGAIQITGIAPESGVLGELTPRGGSVLPAEFAAMIQAPDTAPHAARMTQLLAPSTEESAALDALWHDYEAIFAARLAAAIAAQGWRDDPTASIDLTGDATRLLFEDLIPATQQAAGEAS